MDKESTADSISEPTDTSYERQEITDWTTALDGEVSNSGSIVLLKQVRNGVMYIPCFWQA